MKHDDDVIKFPGSEFLTDLEQDRRSKQLRDVGCSLAQTMETGFVYDAGNAQLKPRIVALGMSTGDIIWALEELKLQLLLQNCDINGNTFAEEEDEYDD